MLRFATSRVACLSKSAIAPIRGEFCPRPFGAFVVGQHRFHTETSSTLQQLLTTPELNLSAEKKDRYSKALLSNEYLTVEDLTIITVEDMLLYGIAGKDARKIHDLLHPAAVSDISEATDHFTIKGDKAYYNAIKECKNVKPNSGELAPISLPGSYKWFTEPSQTLFVRECYDQLFEEISNRIQPSGGVILVGNPGIGKSWFLNYVLIRLLQGSKYDIIFEVPRMMGLHYFKDGEVRLIRWEDRDRFYSLPEVKNNPNIIHLRDFDHDRRVGVPLIEGFTICASSPNPENFKQAKKNFQGFRSGDILYVSLWSVEELSWMNNQHGENQLEATEFRKRLEWVRAPRYMFLSAMSFDEHLSSIRLELFDFRTFTDFIHAVTGADAPKDISHKILGICSGATPSKCTLDFITPAIKKMKLDQAARQNLESRREFFDQLMGVEIAHSIAGHMFESFLHRHLPLHIADRSATVCLEKTASTLPAISNAEYDTVFFKDMPASLTPGTYYRPSAANFACVDSFVVHTSGDVVAFQHTVGKEHPIKAERLAALMKLLSFAFNGTNKFHLVFVVPSTSPESIIARQTLSKIDDMSKRDQKLLADRVVQYRRSLQFEPAVK